MRFERGNIIRRVRYRVYRDNATQGDSIGFKRKITVYGREKNNDGDYIYEY